MCYSVCFDASIRKKTGKYAHIFSWDISRPADVAMGLNILTHHETRCACSSEVPAMHIPILVVRIKSALNELVWIFHAFQDEVLLTPQLTKNGR